MPGALAVQAENGRAGPKIGTIIVLMDMAEPAVKLVILLHLLQTCDKYQNKYLRSDVKETIESLK